MRVAFLYNCASEDPAHNAEDDVPERSPVVAALRRLGHEVTPIACTLNLAAVHQELQREHPGAVFNRVESLGGSDALAAAIPLLLDAMQIPYTGCRSESLVATASKVAVKERLVRAGLPTPEWISADCGLRIADCGFKEHIRNQEFILKSVYEHASFDMDDACVIAETDVSEIKRHIDERSAATGRPFFAERFIDGREFNLSLLGTTSDEPEVLPPAEIDFSAFPAGKPAIVGRGAKWDRDSFEFNHTPRRFDFPPEDEPLLCRLSELAIACWRLFGLNGYARVDFRCDVAGKPWILEINTNPCISPTDGFAAALDQAGIGYDGGIQRIVENALAHAGC